MSRTATSHERDTRASLVLGDHMEAILLETSRTLQPFLVSQLAIYLFIYFKKVV